MDNKFHIQNLKEYSVESDLLMIPVLELSTTSPNQSTSYVLPASANLQAPLKEAVEGVLLDMNKQKALNIATESPLVVRIHSPGMINLKRIALIPLGEKVDVSESITEKTSFVFGRTIGSLLAKEKVSVASLLCPDKMSHTDLLTGIYDTLYQDTRFKGSVNAQDGHRLQELQIVSQHFNKTNADIATHIATGVKLAKDIVG
jgi:leucyl aminopeptidase